MIAAGELRRTAVALATGGTGALLATLAGLPAPALLGATLAVLLVALLGGRPAVPNLLRDPAFAVIGMTLGAGITPSFLSDVARWPLSLLGMVATLLVATALAMRVLQRRGVERGTALLAVSPGALSYALSLSLDRGENVRLVTVMQSIRLVAITVLVPPLLVGAGGAGAPSDAAFSSLSESLVLLLAASLAGIALSRARVPAAWLVGGLAVSAFAQVAGWVEGRPAPFLLFVGFVVAGAVIGSRFAGISRGELRELAWLGAALAALAMAVSALGAALAARMLDLPFGQVWIAYAPGGVEGMAAIAIALDYDPVFVATHHIARLVILFALLPLAIGSGRTRA